MAAKLTHTVWAFPGSGWGMRFREYVAASALQGILSKSYGEAPAIQPEVAAREAVKFADALVIELQKTAQE